MIGMLRTRRLLCAIPVLLVLVLVLAVLNQEVPSLRAKFAREVAAAGLSTSHAPGAVVSETDLSSLPAPAQRYLRFMGVLGRPRDWSFRAGMTGRFRTKPDQSWMPMQAWQYNDQIDFARLFYLRVRFFGLLPVLGRDTYLRGEGRMLIRALDLFTVDDVKGEEVEISELVTYLNDAILLAPSFLLGPGTSWSASEADRFDVALTHGGHTVTARILIDERGAPRDFTTTDRFLQDPYHPERALIRARWSTPIAGWQMVNGRPIPTSGKAVWHLPQGDFAYVEMRFLPESIAFNVRPGE